MPACHYHDGATGIPANAIHRCVWRAGPVTTGGHATERQAPPSRRRATSLNGYLSPEASPDGVIWAQALPVAHSGPDEGRHDVS